MVSDEVDHDYSRLNGKFSLMLLILIPTYSLFCLWLFFYFRGAHPRLYKRNVMLLLLFLSGVLILLYPYAWRFYKGILDFSCRDFYLSITFGYLFILLSIFARLLSLLLKFNFNKALIEFNFEALQCGTFLQQVGVGGDVFISNSEEQLNNERPTLWNLFFRFQLCVKPNPPLPIQLQLPCSLSSHRFINIICAVLVVVSGGVSVVFLQLTSYLSTNERGCTADIAISILVTIFVIIFCIILYFNRRLPNGLGIKSELNIIGSSLVLFVALVSILNYLQDPEEEDDVFAWSLLIWLEVIFVLTISFPYQVYLAKRESRYQIGLEQISIQDVLDDSFGSKALALYSATVLCCENILFLIDVNEFVRLADTLTNYQLGKVAQRIFDKFISIDGGSTLNLNENLIEETQELLENEVIDSTVFDEVVEYVMRSVDDNFFRKFKTSIYFDAFRGILTANDFKC